MAAKRISKVKFYAPLLNSDRYAAKPHRHTVVILDNPLNPNANTLAEEFRADAHPDDTIASHRAELMVRLIHHLQNNVAGPRVCAMKMTDELCLIFASDKDRRTHIRISVDAKDYAPFEDGMPPFHYRVNYTVPVNTKPNPLSVDQRSKNVQDVAQFVLEAIDRCR